MFQLPLKSHRQLKDDVKTLSSSLYLDLQQYLTESKLLHVLSDLLDRIFLLSENFVSSYRLVLLNSSLSAKQLTVYNFEQS